MSLVLLTLSCVRPAHAQGGYPGGGYPGGGYPGGGYPGGGWTVTDQAGNALDTDPNGGYKLRGPMTGSATPTGAYQDILTLSQQPNFSMGFPFTPCPPSYQGWLVTGAPDSGYDPYHIWADVQASNNASGAGWLGQPYNENINGSMTANTGGTLWAVFQWNGSQPPPVDHLDLLLCTTVSASASASTYGSPAQPGGSATATATDSTFNETATASADGSGGGVPLVTGRHLLRVPVDPNTGKAQASLGGTTTATATANVPYGVMGNYPGTTYGNYYQQTNGPAGANASASIGATASIDSREVYITCFEIEDSSHSGPLDAANSYPKNVRAGDGSIVTDSAVSPPLNQPGGSISWTASPTLFAQATAFQNPTFAWSVSGEGSSSAGNSNQTVFSINIPASTSDRALNKQSAVQVTVTDGDGATAANSFTVRWHYPKENAVLLAIGAPYWQPIVSSNVTATGYIHGDATGDFGIATYNDFVPTAVADIFPVASSITPVPIWAAFVAALGVKAGDIKPDVHSVSTNFDQCWNSPYSTGLPVPLDPALMNTYQMNPLLVVQYQEQTWQYDQYGQKGYLGPAQEGVDHFMGSVESAGEFSKIGPPPTGGA